MTVGQAGIEVGGVHASGGRDGSDAHVIARSLTHPESFAVVFDRHGRRVHRFLASRLGRQGADDLLTEVFLTAFRRRASYDLDRDHALPWLLGIATYVVAQHRRDGVREIRLHLAVVPDAHHASHADDVDAQVTAGAIRDRLVAAVNALAPEERHVLLLVSWDHLRYDEVAEALDIPVGTVRSRLHRARVKVRAALGGVDPTSVNDPQEADRG